jgi:tetratricopeptide (TPR) repeat protein
MIHCMAPRSFSSLNYMGAFDALFHGSPEEVVECLLSSGDIKGAVTVLEYFKKYDIECNDLNNNLACLHYCLGDYTTAARLFETESKQDIPRGLINLACCHFASGNLEQCKEILSSTKSMRMVEDTRTLRHRIIACLRESTDPSDFLPDNVGDQLCLARMYYDDQDFTKTISVLSRLVPLAGEDIQSTLFSFIGRCFFDLGNLKESILYSNRSSEFLNSQIIAASCMHAMGDSDKADFSMYKLRHLENDLVENNRCVFTNGCGGDIVWSSPACESARYNLGCWYLGEARFKDVVSLFSNAEELSQDEKFVKANAFIGLANDSDLDLVQAEYTREAIALLETITQDHLTTISDGMMCFIQGDYKTALACWEKDDDRVGNWNRGVCFGKTGRWLDAIEKFVKTPESELRSFWLLRSFIQTAQHDFAFRQCLQYPSLWKVAGAEFVAMGRFVEGFDCYMKGKETDDVSACISGLNDCTKSLFEHVVETGRMHTELDLLVARLKQTRDNPAGIKVVEQIEEWIKNHLS